jgi:hypothetical protein
MPAIAGGVAAGSIGAARRALTTFTSRAAVDHAPCHRAPVADPVFPAPFMSSDHSPRAAGEPTGGRPAWSLAAFAAAVTLGLGIWCAWWVAWRVPDAYPFGDGALTELYTTYVIRGAWGLGPYSRFGWHHPGPLYFYLLAPYYIIGGQHGLALHAGALAINILSLIAVAGLLRRHASASMTAAMLIGVALYLHRLPRLVTSVWNPHVLVLPYAALIFASAITASGRLALLPLTIVCASFIAQTHVGLAPSAVILTACAAIGGIWSGRRRPRDDARSGPQGPQGPQDGGSSTARGWHASQGSQGSQGSDRSRRPRGAAFWLAVSAGVALVCWLPTIYDELTTSPGNLTLLVQFFRDTHDTSLPAGTALATWADVITAPLRPGFALAHGNASAQLPPPVWLAPCALGGLVLLLVAGFWSARRGYLVEARICQLNAVASAIALLSVASIRGGLADHLTFWISLNGLLAAGALAGVCGLWVASRVSLRLPSRLSPRLPAIAVSGLTFAVILFALLQGTTFLREQRDAILQRENVPPIGRLYRATRTAIAKAGLQRPRIEVMDAWSDAAGIALQLHKRHVPFSMERRWIWMFGAPLRERGDEDGVVVIANPESSRQLSQEPDNCLVTVVHQTSIYLRAPSAAQRDRLECLPGEMAWR